MIRVISKQLALALTVLSFSLSLAHADPQSDGAAGNGGGATPPASGAITPRPEDADNDKKDEQLDSDKKISAASSAMATAQTTGVANGGLFPQHATIVAAEQKYASNKPTCVKMHSGAAGACLEHLSPNILTGVTTLNTILSTLGGAAVKDQCSGFANAMDLAKAAMTAYTAACGTMKAGCGASCVGARKGLEDIQKAIGSHKPDCSKATPQQKTACEKAVADYVKAQAEMLTAAKEELNKAEKKSMAGKASLCTDKYAQLLTSGLAGIASLLNSAKQGKNCEEKANGTGTDVAANEVCKDPAKAKTEECLCQNPQSPECICFKNPRTSGCPGGLPGVGENSAGELITTGPTDKSNVAAAGGTPNLGPSGGGMQLGERSPNSADSGGVGAPTGGGATGLGGGSGGGSGSGTPGAEGSGKKGLDANILGGAGGGGGGGGSWGSSGGGSEKYRAYLPGGAKDPGKAAGQQAWTKEVTGQGGKSNWEKVKERYRDNKNTLLNN